MQDNVPRDPVCGLEVNPEDVDAWVEYGGTQYFFCCPECQKAFEEKPEEYAGGEAKRPEGKQTEGAGRQQTRHQART